MSYINQNVPSVDSSANTELKEVIGNKEDAGALTADTASLVALARKSAKEAWEVEHHFHTRQRAFGLGAASEGFTPYTIPAGATDDTFGAWTEIFAAEDTPFISGQTHYDPDLVLLYDIPKTKECMIIQFAWGASGAAGYAAGDYTEEYMLPEKPADGKSTPVRIPFKRIAVGTPLWCRGAQENANTSDDGDFEIFVHAHGYTDPDV
ncbi:MAG: hypothetical protein GY807_18975 [Gammaproteobacteria bacterium]|nr:hypothetical protein [Gammaproteobacteria bacterium]